MRDGLGAGPEGTEVGNLMNVDKALTVNPTPELQLLGPMLGLDVYNS